MTELRLPTRDDRNQLRHFRSSSLAATPPIIDRSFHLYQTSATMFTGLVETIGSKKHRRHSIRAVS